MVQLAETAKALEEEQQQTQEGDTINVMNNARDEKQAIEERISAHRGQKFTREPKRGRPSDPQSHPSVAERIGIPRQTLDRAEAHVNAVEKEGAHAHTAD
jgi:hypothetical protein